MNNDQIKSIKDPAKRRAEALKHNAEVRKRVSDAGTPPEMQDYVLSGKEKQAADQDQADTTMEKLMAMQDDGDGNDSEDQADEQLEKRKKALASKK